MSLFIPFRYSSIRSNPFRYNPVLCPTLRYSPIRFLRPPSHRGHSSPILSHAVRSDDAAAAMCKTTCR